MLGQSYYGVNYGFQTTDSFLKGIYNYSLLKTLQMRFGPFRQHHANILVSTKMMSNLLRKMRRKKPRRGEVVMVIPDELGQIWLHTKASYPAGVYRLMSGGLDPGELPHNALLREAQEETGFEVTIERCLAVVTYNFRDQESWLPFVSYIFLTSPVSCVPSPIDPNEAITGFKAVPPAQLLDVARQLRRLNGRFADWGNFRAVAHEAVGRCLG